VVRVNTSARHLLGLRESVPFPVLDLPRERAFRDVMNAGLAGTATEPAELTVGDHALAVTARPLRNGGAVLALLDLTPFRKLDAMRRDFVANVSHELRTPLTVINGFAETLVDDPELNDQSRRFAEMIRASTRRMQSIVDDLLDLSRIESGGWKPVTEQADLATIAREAAAPSRPAAAERGVVIQIDVTDAPRLQADAVAIRQIIGNLVSNAVRIPRPGPSQFSHASNGRG